jgi:hypothetical protein
LPRLAVTLVLGLLLSLASSASALAACVTGRTNTDYVGSLFDGWFTFGAPVYTAAQITERDAYVPTCTNTIYTNCNSSVWIMLANSFSLSYAQIGYYTDTTGARTGFIQYGDNYHPLNIVEYRFPAFPLNSTQTYQMGFGPTGSGNIFYYFLNNIYVGQHIALFTPNEAEHYAEIHSEASQISGTPTTPVDFNYSAVLENGAANPRAFNGQVQADRPYFNVYAYSPIELNVDDTCHA